MAVTHSQLTDKQRYDQWLAIATGRKRIAVGTRSALFLPFRKLSLIIVDEEHDTSYKQEEGFRYQARDLAVVRAKLAQAAIVLGSATPSLETLWNCESGRYHKLVLKDRPFDAVLPQLRIVDLKRFLDPKGRTPLISEPLRVAIETHLSKKRQVLLFLNRRGYATFILCNTCGESLRCDNCSVALTFHREVARCKCHYCLKEIPLPPTCPGCGAPALAKLGSGTERLESIVSALWPKARILRVDRDVLASKKRMADFYQRMCDREIDILLGTQLLAKGHDFPHITLVGVINADLELNFPDFRAEERSFQSLLQVSGRAGRGRIAGEVFIQTANPEHPLFHHLVSHDPDGFWEKQLAERRRFAYPPWTAFVQIELSGTVAAQVRAYSETLAAYIKASLPANRSLSLLGPSPAPIEKVRGNYRFHLILRGTHRQFLKSFLNHCEPQIQKIPLAVRVSLDVDPYSLM